MRSVVRPLSLLVIGIGTVATVLTVAIPASEYVWYALAGLSLLAAIAGATRRAAIEHPAAILVCLIVACAALAVVARAAIAEQTSADLFATAFELCATSGVIIGLGRLLAGRPAHATDGVVGSAIAIALGAWIVAWVTIAQPRVQHGDERLVAVLSSFSLAAGSVALFLVGMVLSARTARRPTTWMFSFAVTCGIAGNLVLTMVGADQIGPGAAHVAIALYVLAFALAAAGFLESSSTSMHIAASASAEPLGFGRIIIATSALAIPVIVLAIAEPRGTADKLIRSISATVLAGIVTIRVIQVVRSTRHAQAELLRTAQTDPLTGLANRTLLLERLEQSLQDSWHGNLRPTLYFVDLDRFKNINDSLGHAAGDQVLCTVAGRLLLAIPERAMVFRLSGDEYVVLDPGSVGESSTVLADRLLAVFSQPLPLHQGDLFVTASLGIATINANTRTNAEDLLRHADTAMYRAKDAGRNCAVLYDESMHERVAHRLSLETALHRALDRRELKLFHQPILDIDTGDVVGFEALMRWQRADGTIVSPAEFIPIAEDNGTIIPIGAWALLDALSQLRRWLDEGVCSPTATMSVNVSPRQLADPDFPAIVSEALSRSGIQPGSLWLEITEGVMISEPELALATLQKMVALGVQVALDDFGTGYSSLSLLQRFPLQRIKIDRAFVQGVANSMSDRSLVRTIVAMGGSLGLDLVAEGVETIQQLQVLRELGCHKAQGYLISHPVPADAMRSTVVALERLGRTALLHGDVRSS